MDEQVWNFMEHYLWEGNVRELKNVVEYMVNITDGDLPIFVIYPYLYDRWDQGGLYCGYYGQRRL